MSQLLRFNLDKQPSLGMCLIFSLQDETLEYVQPAPWYQILYHRFPALVRINGREYRQPADCLAIVPPRAVFSLRRESEPGVYLSMNFQPNPEATYPLHFDQVFPAGDFSEGLDQLLRRAIDRLVYMRAHAEAALWVTLCHFGRVPTEAERPADIQQLELWIDSRLHQAFTISDLTEEVGISHSTLLRLAKDYWGMTPLDYVKSRKMELAAQLLTGSSKTIKQVAIAIGMPDLQQFNKQIRTAFGVSPRKLRESAPYLNIHEQRKRL
jgi:AraC-like DNA-binding protein